MGKEKKFRPKSCLSCGNISSSRYFFRFFPPMIFSDWVKFSSIPHLHISLGGRYKEEKLVLTKFNDSLNVFLKATFLFCPWVFPENSLKGIFIRKNSTKFGNRHSISAEHPGVFFVLCASIQSLFPPTVWIWSEQCVKSIYRVSDTLKPLAGWRPGKKRKKQRNRKKFCLHSLCGWNVVQNYIFFEKKVEQNKRAELHPKIIHISEVNCRSLVSLGNQWLTLFVEVDKSVGWRLVFAFTSFPTPKVSDSCPSWERFLGADDDWRWMKTWHCTVSIAPSVEWQAGWVKRFASNLPVQDGLVGHRMEDELGFERVKKWVSISTRRV